MAKTAAAAPHPTVELVPLARIIESPTNPRKTFTDIEDLAEDLKKRGVLQPVLLRPVSRSGMASNFLELVFGARRFRAAKLAGLSAIPAMVRELTVTEALEIQIVENSARQDVHPMEEAEGYEALRAADGAKYSVEEIAAKVGRSPSYVYGRMKLLALCKEGREAFYKGRLTASSALLVARVPDQAVQREILKDLGRWGRGPGEAYSTADVSDVVQRHLLRLSDAQFDRKDAELVPAAGACATCPKRSGAQPELFGDVDKRDELCTDPRCFREKTETAWARRRAAAEAKGLKVLDGKAAEKACEYGGEYVKLAEHNFKDPKSRTWKQLLGKAANEHVVLARDQRGQVHELVPKKETAKLLKAAGHNFKSDSPSRLRTGSKTSAAGAAKERESQEVETAIERRIAEIIVARFEGGEFPPTFWRLAARMVLDSAEFSLDRRLGDDWQRKDPKAADTLVDVLTVDQACGFVLEVLFERAIYDTGWTPPSEKGVREELLAWAGVDRKAIAAAVKAERAIVAPPAGAGEKKAGKTKRKAKAAAGEEA